MTDLLSDTDELMPDVNIAADENTVNIPTSPAAVNLYVKLVKEWIPTVTDLDDICEARRQAEIIRLDVFKRMDREVEYGPAAVCRRIERHLGILIRRGQDAGTIRLRGEHTAEEDQRISPRIYMRHSHERSDIYLMAGVTDDAFDKALLLAREDKNMTRTNVVRRIKTVCPELDTHPEKPNPKLRANPLLYRTRRIDPNRVVRETAIALEGLVMGLKLIDITTVEPAVAADSAISIATSMRAVGRFVKEINKEINNGSD